MHPWTDEEKLRQRNTGFVCFMNRDDAEEAMEAFCETDAFQNGRRLMLRWGKNVRARNLVKKGTGVPARFRSTRTQNNTPHTNTGSSPQSPTKTARDDSDIVSCVSTAHRTNSNKASTHANDAAPDDIEMSKAIRVVPPLDPNRVRFISAVAAVVARDGSAVERLLMERVALDKAFGFLFPAKDTALSTDHEERLFYKWRVYAYAQGDGDHQWRLKPFRMMAVGVGGSTIGKWWIPPSLLDTEAAHKEGLQKQQREDEIAAQQARRHQVKQEVIAIKDKKKYMTGRQLEQARMEGIYTLGGGGGGSGNTQQHHYTSSMKAKRGEEPLSFEELEEFTRLVQMRLTSSREAICQAMAFCLEKSGSALDICQRLKDIALEEVHPYVHVHPRADQHDNKDDDNSGAGKECEEVRVRVSLETRMARLFLLSDLLFNSQQPGVRNAFRFRLAIEELLPQLFESFQKLSSTHGRLTFQKMQRAISAVTRAWSSWSVYDETFIQNLLQVFDGKRTAEDMRTGNKKGKQIHKKDGGSEEAMSAHKVDAHAPGAVVDQGATTTALSEDNAAKFHNAEVKVSTPLEQEDDDDDDVDGEPLADDAMVMEGTGTAFAEGEPPHTEQEDDDLDGEPVSDAEVDVDGSPLLDDDIGDGGNTLPGERERTQDTGPGKSDDRNMNGEDAEINDDDGNADDVDGEEIDDGDVDVDGEELADDVDGEEVDDEDNDMV
jgi:hypothetical protein